MLSSRSFVNICDLFSDVTFPCVIKAGCNFQFGTNGHLFVVPPGLVRSQQILQGYAVTVFVLHRFDIAVLHDWVLETLFDQHKICDWNRNWFYKYIWAIATIIHRCWRTFVWCTNLKNIILNEVLGIVQSGPNIRRCKRIRMRLG